MATFYGAQKSSPDGVMSWYEEQDQVNFIIYRHNTKSETARYEGNNKEIGFERLNRFLTEIEPTDFAIYILQLIPSGKKKDATAPCVTFQLYKNQPSQYQPGMYQMNEVVSKLNAIQSRLDRVENEEEDEDEDDQPESVGGQNIPKSPMELIAGVLMQPQMQSVIITLLTNIAGNLMTPKTAPVTAVAGVETDSTDIAKSLETLFSKGVTPADLEKLAAMDQGQINFLLSMLRK